MKNKEIEKILKYLKNNTYMPDETKRKYKILHRDEVNLLLSYIKQLENNRDKAINFIKHIKSILKEYNYEPYRVNTALDDLLRMLGEIDE